MNLINNLNGFTNIKEGLEKLIKGWELLGYDKQVPIEYEQMKKQLYTITEELKKWQ